MQLNLPTKEANPLIWTMWYYTDGIARPGLTWMEHQAVTQRAKVVETIRLLDAGCDPNETHENSTAISVAIMMSFHEVVDKLLEAGADVKHPANFKNSVINKWIGRTHGQIDDASALRELDVFHKLLHAGADVHMRDENGNTFLHVAQRYVNPYAITALVAAGLDINTPNNDGQTVLHHSLSNWRMEAFNAILAASPNINACDHAGHTALYYAIKGSALDDHKCQATLDIIRRLIEENAATDITDSEGNSLLHLAMCWGYNETPFMSHHQQLAIRHKLVALLIERGLDVNARNHLGQTPLMLAVDICDLESVRHLCAAPGIDLSARDLMGYTAMYRATKALGSIEKYETCSIDLNPNLRFGFRTLSKATPCDDRSAELTAPQSPKGRCKDLIPDMTPLPLTRSRCIDSIPFTPTIDDYKAMIELLS